MSECVSGPADGEESGAAEVRRPRRALITGLTGQDGSFLAELLLEKGYSVSGLVRGGPARTLGSAEHLRESVQLLEGDLLEPLSLRDAIERADPDELYHLAGPSFVLASWERPSETFRAITGSAAAPVEATPAGDSQPSGGDDAGQMAGAGG